jgi:hypothetical protein
LVLRERYAFGACDPEPAGRYQWFELQPAGESTGPLGQPGWRLDGDALRYLADRVCGAPADPATYDIADDLWAAARHWLLHASWRRRVGLAAAGLAGDTACRLWESLPMRLRYLRESLARGQPPRPAVLADPLEALADLASPQEHGR